MRHEKQRASLLVKLENLVDAFLLKVDIADGECLVDQEDVGIDVGGNGKTEAHIHAAGIVLDGHVNEVAQLGKIDYRGQQCLDLAMGKPEKRALEENVFITAQVRMETRAELEHGEYAPVGNEFSAGRLGDSSDDFEQRRFARAIDADYSKR